MKNSSLEYAIFFQIKTIIDKKFYISQRNIDLIHKLNQLNINFVIVCTSNDIKYIKKCREILNNRYFMIFNYSIVYDFYDQKSLLNFKLDNDKSRIILDFAKKNNISFFAIDMDNKQIYNNISNFAQLALIIKLFSLKQIKDLSLNNHNGIDFLALRPKNLNQKNKIINFLNNLDIKFSIENEFIQIVNQNINIFFVTKQLIALWKIEWDNVMTLIESKNYFPNCFSYALANFNLETKNKVKYHVSKMEQNGLSEAILDFISRKKMGKTI